MTTIKQFCAAALIATGLSGAAYAETPGPGGSASGRFSMSPVEGGFLRLDSETGAVAICARSGSGEWACKAVEGPMSGSSLSDLSRLEEENRELKDRIRSLEDLNAPPGGKAQLPTEEEIDQALSYLERVYKKFRDRMKDLEKPEPAPIEPPPKGSL